MASPKDHDPKTFELFPKLSPELRLTIWHYALADATSHDPALIKQLHSAPYLSKEPPPALLHTNREARCEALKIFTSRTINFRNGQRPLILFFNPDAQTLFLDPAPEEPRDLDSTSPCCRKVKNGLYCRCTSSRYSYGTFISGNPCEDACMARKQLYLFDRFRSADTSEIKRIALRMPKCGACRCYVVLIRRLKDRYPQAEDVSLRNGDFVGQGVARRIRVSMATGGGHNGDNDDDHLVVDHRVFE